MEDLIIKQAITTYQEIFGSKPNVVVKAPGRVNLIGEHTDYNDGFVLPFALPFITVMVGSITKNPQTRIYSCNMDNGNNDTENKVDDGIVSFTIDSRLKKENPKWANYVKGTIYQYLQDLPQPFAFNAVICSNVPIGSGLSSSASLEVATATFLEALLKINYVDGVQKALRCQKAEHTFADTPCGIMDQYISSMGKKGNLLLIDCRSKDYKLIPFGDGNDTPVIVITNSNVKHALSGSEYPDRVKQCKAAVAGLVKKGHKVEALRDATIEMLQDARSTLDAIAYKRAKHCITEDARTMNTIEALGKSDYVTVGRNMSDSHVSLQIDFEVSCKELDLLQQYALEVNGVYGSRMTGGGFGGCTVTLLNANAVEAFKEYVSKKYVTATGKECAFYEAIPSDGAEIIDVTTLPSSMFKKKSSLWDFTLPILIVGISTLVAIKVFK
jgi:galactokinase